MSLINRSARFSLLLVMLCTLSACNTLQGVDEDASDMGYATSNTAKQTFGREYVLYRT